MASGFRASVCGEQLPKRLPPALSMQVAGYSVNYYFHSLLYFLQAVEVSWYFPVDLGNELHIITSECHLLEDGRV